MTPTHTCWYKVTDEGLKFNHLQDGYDAEQDEPTPLCELHRLSWTKALWIAKPAVMDGIVVIECATSAAAEGK